MVALRWLHLEHPLKVMLESSLRLSFALDPFFLTAVSVIRCNEKNWGVDIPGGPERSNSSPFLKAVASEISLPPVSMRSQKDSRMCSEPP